MEKDPPSFNDLIFTTVGGTYLGETLFRISSRILDDRARGLERAGRELLGFVLNPAGGLTRLLSGQVFRYQSSPDQTSEPFETTFVIGRTEAATPLGKWGTFELNAAHHLLAVFKGSSGADRATFLEASYAIPVYKSWSVGFEYVNVRRDSNYRDVPDVRTNTSDFRLIGAVGF
jgi:hypothetical protein